MTGESAVRRDEETRIRRVYEARRGLESRYSWLRPGHQLIMQSAERGLLAALRRAGIASLRDARVLEIGCGTGYWLRALVQWGAQPNAVAGIDLLADRLTQARGACAPSVMLAGASATALPFPEATFDVVMQVTMMTSVLSPDVRRGVAAEMLRVLRPAGVVLWYDFFVNNPRNPDVRGIGRAEIASLFPGCRVRMRRVTLAPPLSRLVAPLGALPAALLGAIPLLRTHYAGTVTRAC